MRAPPAGQGPQLWCKDGVIGAAAVSGDGFASVCCPAACSKCGGVDCWTQNAGLDCCAKHVYTRGVECSSTTSTACIIPVEYIEREHISRESECVDLWGLAFPREREVWQARSCKYKVEWQQCSRFYAHCQCSCGYCLSTHDTCAPVTTSRVDAGHQMQLPSPPASSLSHLGSSGSKAQDAWLWLRHAWHASLPGGSSSGGHSEATAGSVGSALGGLSRLRSRLGTASPTEALLCGFAVVLLLAVLCCLCCYLCCPRCGGDHTADETVAVAEADPLLSMGSASPDSRVEEEEAAQTDAELASLARRESEALALDAEIGPSDSVSVAGAPDAPPRAPMPCHHGTGLPAASSCRPLSRPLARLVSWRGERGSAASHCDGGSRCGGGGSAASEGGGRAAGNAARKAVSLCTLQHLQRRDCQEGAARGRSHVPPGLPAAQAGVQAGMPLINAEIDDL